MVFTDLTLDEMMALIGVHTVEKDEFNASHEYQCEKLVLESPSFFDITRDIRLELGRILRYTEENCVSRAYDLKFLENAEWGRNNGRYSPSFNKPMHHFFLSGERGYISRVVDFGRGFYAQEFIKATVEDRRLFGIHYHTGGSGFDCFRDAKHHLVNIDSTIGVGTSVNILHEY